jgi:tetratricopeptide (TPR) repeat protein
VIILFKWFFLYVKLFWYKIVLCFVSTHKGSYYANIGVIHFALEQYVEAITEFRKSEELNDRQDNSLLKYNTYYLGYSYLNLGNHQQAVKYFEKYLYFEPENAEIIEFAAWCNLLLYKHETALNYYLRLVDLEPGIPIYLIESAKILLEIDKRDEAYKLLESAKKLNHGVALDMLVESLKYKSNNDLKHAALLLERAIEKITPDKNNPLYSLIGDIYLQLSEYKKESGDVEGSVTVLEGLYSVTPDDFWVINSLSLEYADMGVKLKKALGQINRCLHYQPENSFFMDTKGWVLFKMGRIKEAKKLIKKSLKLNPNAKEAQAHYKMIRSHFIDQKDQGDTL